MLGLGDDPRSSPLPCTQGRGGRFRAASNGRLATIQSNTLHNLICQPTVNVPSLATLLFDSFDSPIVPAESMRAIRR